MELLMISDQRVVDIRHKTLSKLSQTNHSFVVFSSEFFFLLINL